MKGGIRLEARKESSLVTWTIRRSEPPSYVTIPLFSSATTSTEPCVRIGDSVLRGEKVACATNDSSVDQHASISGTVRTIKKCYDGYTHSLAIEIESDGRDQAAPGVGQERQGWEALSFEESCTILKEAGVVGLGGDMMPVHVKIQQARHAGIRQLILNGCESEPYLSCDHALMMSHPVEILWGAELLRRMSGAEKFCVATEEDKREPAEVLKSKIFFLKWPHAEVRLLRRLYPQGHEGLLVSELLNTVHDIRRPVTESGAVVFNVATAFAVYQAIRFCIPLQERAVTLGGECLVEATNAWIRFGTPFTEALKLAKGLLRSPRKLIMGGPMLGRAQADADVPVTAATKGILALPKEVAPAEEIQPCIRCGRCVEVCPVPISPVLLTLAAEQDIFDLSYGGDVHQCIECGNCAYVCPSKRPMVELLRYAKAHAL